ncbi:hypothetical protein EhVM1_000163 [Emiliania huxleyi virus M1]|nr:hypothetical protein EhVM1_000163 [Emiliania huxleyi virus M1]
MNHDISAVASLFAPRNHHYWRKNCKRVGDNDNCKYAKDPFTYKCIQNTDLVQLPSYSVDATYWCFSTSSLENYLKENTNTYPFARIFMTSVYRYIASNHDIYWLIAWCYILRKIQSVCAIVTENYGGNIGFVILNTPISGQTDTSGNITQLGINEQMHQNLDGMLSLLNHYNTSTLTTMAHKTIERIKNTEYSTDISPHEEVRTSTTNDIPFIYI